jgi:hypothetical protein
MVGRLLVAILWGDAFAPAVDTVSICLVMIIPMWIGFQHGDAALLQHKPLLAVKTAAWLLAVFLVAFALLCRWGGAVGTAVAMLLGASVSMVTAIWYVWREWKVHLQVGRLVVPFVVVLAAIPAARWVHGGATAAVATGAWLALFAAAALLARALTWSEIKDILRILRPSRATPPSAG